MGMGTGHVQLTINGKQMPKSVLVAEMRLKLLNRAVDLEAFKGSYFTHKTYEELAVDFDITISDVSALVAWHELSRSRPVVTRNSRRSIDVDALAERLYLYMEPKIAAMVDARVEAALK